MCLSLLLFTSCVFPPSVSFWRSRYRNIFKISPQVPYQSVPLLRNIPIDFLVRFSFFVIILGRVPSTSIIMSTIEAFIWQNYFNYLENLWMDFQIHSWTFMPFTLCSLWSGNIHNIKYPFLFRRIVRPVGYILSLVDFVFESDHVFYIFLRYKIHNKKQELHIVAVIRIMVYLFYSFFEKKRKKVWKI